MHTRNVKSEKEEDKKSVFTKLKDYGTRNVKTDNPFEEPAPEKKKGVFSKFFKGREESEEIIEPEAQEPAVENDDFETFRFCNKVIFYKAGICIIGNNILTKYNYHTRDEETSEKGIEGSFLVSNVDDERLKTDSEYMKKFVEEICKPARLKAVRDKQFQYIGGFNKDDEFEVDNNIALDVIKLREKYNEYMEAKNR